MNNFNATLWSKLRLRSLRSLEFHRDTGSGVGPLGFRRSRSHTGRQMHGTKYILIAKRLAT